MRRHFWLYLVATLTSVLSIIGCARSDDQTPLIFAAASLADVLTEASEEYERQTGEEVDFNFGGSTSLANQIARLEAPADAVIMAGQGPISRLTDTEAVATSDVAIIARNSLVVVSQGNAPLDSLSELATTGSRIAIADPSFAPAGQYAREALISANAWVQVESEVVPTLDVRAALAAVSSGSVEFAIVYSTDALTETSLDVVLEIDRALHQSVIYPAAVVSSSNKTSSAQSFIDFLLSAEGQRIFASHGFRAA